MNCGSTAYYSTTLGVLGIHTFAGYLTAISFATEEDLANSSPDAMTDFVIAQIREYLAGQRTSFEVPIKTYGTEFQEQVWQALTQIDYGKTASYKDIAIAIGNPKAARAVGMANNKNPIPIIIPCHRVINQNGKLGGYAPGLDFKEQLLALESAHSGWVKHHSLCNR